MKLLSTLWMIIHGTLPYFPLWLYYLLSSSYKNAGIMHPVKSPQMDGFFKVTPHKLPRYYIYIYSNSVFLDSVLAITPSVDETVPYFLYWRESFPRSRRLLLIQWLIMGNILSHVYKGALLSSLITIQYTKTLDTMSEMEQSGIPLMCPANTVICWLLKTDPRPLGIKLNERRVDMPFPGYTDEKYLKL